MNKNNRISKWFNTFVIGVLISSTSFYVCAAQLIPFQARLTDVAGVPVANGVYAINFAIYDTATGGIPVNGWVEPHPSVSVISGVVNVILGSITPFNDPNNNGDLADAVTFYSMDGNRFVGVTIDAGQEMVPRHQFIPSFHAVTADNAANFGNQPPSFYSSVTDHELDLQQLVLDSESSIQKVVTDHTADLQTVNNRIDQLDSLLVPTGTVMAFAGNVTSVPFGWFLCDGSSKVRGTNSNLFSVIGIAHGTGDSGITTFSLPDYRGRFLRGQDLGQGRDPDVTARTGTDGSSNTGDAVGSIQNDLIQSHSHPQITNGSDSDVHPQGGTYNSGSRFLSSTGTFTAVDTALYGGNETRPKNIYVNYIIKY